MSNDFFFPNLDPAEDGTVPVPPEAMRFLELRGEAVLDDLAPRARVYVEVSAFQKRPYIEVVMLDEDGVEVAAANVIEPMQRKHVFTLHLRGGRKSGIFTLKARMYYPSNAEDPTHTEGMTILEADQAEAQFVFPAR
ncbi:MAG: hypothetical protein Fur0035_16030 [Anaerolineales bacterium]